MSEKSEDHACHCCHEHAACGDGDAARPAPSADDPGPTPDGYLLSRLRLKAAAGQLAEADMGEVDSYFGAEKPVHEKLVQVRRSANGS